ncbi:MAG: FAD-dependent oxidoreductase [Bacillota bacterium]
MIEIYTVKNKPYSKMAKAIFESRDCTFQEYDIRDEKLYQEMLVRSGGAETAPQIFIDDEYIGDYNDLVAAVISGKLDAMLDIKREIFQEKWDLVVVGAGPAGINAGLYAARRGLKTILLGTNMGGQMLGAGNVENYPGEKSIQGDELMETFWHQLLNYDITIRLGEKVNGLEKMDEEQISVKLKGNKFLKSKAIILATGSKYRKLNVQGEQRFAGRGIHHCVICEGDNYAGMPVAVVGGGNSGMEAALDLAELGCEVKLIDIHKELSGEDVLVEEVRSSQNITLYPEKNVERILGKEKLVGVEIKDRNSNNTEHLKAAAVFTKIGLIPNTSFLDETLDLNDREEIIIDENNRTSMDGVWAAGDVTDIRDKQIIVAAAEGAKSALRVNESI